MNRKPYTTPSAHSIGLEVIDGLRKEAREKTSPTISATREMVNRISRVALFVLVGVALAYLLFGCAGCGPSFDVAEFALESSDETGAVGHEDGIDGSNTDDAGTMGSDGVSPELRPDAKKDSAPVLEVAADSAKDDGAPGDAMGAETTHDAPCALHDHKETVFLSSWQSCTPTGVVGVPSTYNLTLLDETIAHSKVGSPYAWGDRQPVACPAAAGCWAVPLTMPTGVAWVVWCLEGATAGRAKGANMGKPEVSCPTVEMGGTWQ